MKVTILETTPVSGDFPEYSFGEGFHSFLWVEFRSSGDEIWYGCFAKLLDNGFSGTFVDNIGKTAFIVAGGLGYLIDRVNKKLMLKTEDYPVVESAIKTNAPEYYIAGMFCNAYVIDTKGKVQTIEPGVITDGIFFTGQRGNKAVGKLDAAMNQYSNKYDFEVDLETFQFCISENRKPDFWARLFGK